VARTDPLTTGLEEVIRSHFITGNCVLIRLLKDIGLFKTPNELEEHNYLKVVQEDLRRNPNEVENYLRLGLEFYANGQIERAIRILSDGKDRFPEDVEILYALALTLKKNGEKEKALTLFRKVTLLAEKLEDHSKSRILRRMAVGHANVIAEGNWNLSEETWETK
jgi:tetratricopeptide (TPR) repeat protein